MGKNSRAEKLVRERLEVAPTANLMCVLGNLLEDPSWHEKAWEFSGKRYARAKRLLGVGAYEKGDYAASIGHLEEALSINPGFPYTWFRLGAAAMRVGQWQLARNAFGQCVSREPEDGDAWANLCSIHIKLGQIELAHKAIAEAVKRSRNNWRIWENYVTLSLDTQQWSMAVEGIRNLIDLRAGLGSRSDKQGEVDVHALSMVVQAALEERGAAIAQGLVPGAWTSTLKRQLDSLLDKIRAECKSDARVWAIMASYYAGLEDADKHRDCLERRVRALQVPDWERGAATLEHVVGAVEDYLDAQGEDRSVAKTVVAMARQGGALQDGSEIAGRLDALAQRVL